MLGSVSDDGLRSADIPRVEGGGKNLAVECDGDRFHPFEKLKEDMERQAILERQGWKFARIRGNHFFRNPDQSFAIQIRLWNLSSSD